MDLKYVHIKQRYFSLKRKKKLQNTVTKNLVGQGRC
jgi:hypothetical protein